MQLRSEVEQCHKEPVEKLNKQEQKLVLQIIEREAQLFAERVSALACSTSQRVPYDIVQPRT